MEGGVEAIKWSSLKCAFLNYELRNYWINNRFRRTRKRQH